MAYWLDTQECISIPVDLWPRVYEFREWHTGKVVSYEFKSQVDFDEQCENNSEVRGRFKLQGDRYE